MRKTLFVITLLLALLVASAALVSKSADGNWEYITEGDTVIISYYRGKDSDTVTSITVPTIIDGKAVSGMSGNPFAHCDAL